YRSGEESPLPPGSDSHLRGAGQCHPLPDSVCVAAARGADLGTRIQPPLGLAASHTGTGDRFRLRHGAGVLRTRCLLPRYPLRGGIGEPRALLDGAHLLSDRFGVAPVPSSLPLEPDSGGGPFLPTDSL